MIVEISAVLLFRQGELVVAKNYSRSPSPDRARPTCESRSKKQRLPEESFAELRRIWSLSTLPSSSSGPLIWGGSLQHAACVLLSLTFAVPFSSALDIYLIAAVIQSLNVANLIVTRAPSLSETSLTRRSFSSYVSLRANLRLSRTRLKINRYCLHLRDTTVLACSSNRLPMASQMLSRPSFCKMDILRYVITPPIQYIK